MGGFTRNRCLRGELVSTPIHSLSEKLSSRLWKVQSVGRRVAFSSPSREMVIPLPIQNRHTVYQHRYSPHLAARKSIFSDLHIIHHQTANHHPYIIRETKWNREKSATADPRHSFSAQRRMHYLRGFRKVVTLYFNNIFNVRISHKNRKRENGSKQWRRSDQRVWDTVSWKGHITDYKTKEKFTLQKHWSEITQQRHSMANIVSVIVCGRVGVPKTRQNIKWILFLIKYMIIDYRLGLGLVYVQIFGAVIRMRATERVKDYINTLRALLLFYCAQIPPLKYGLGINWPFGGGIIGPPMFPYAGPGPICWGSIGPHPWAS